MNCSTINLLRKWRSDRKRDGKVRNSTKIMSYNMLSFDKLYNKSKVFAELTGVKLKQFHKIIRKVRQQ